MTVDYGAFLATKRSLTEQSGFQADEASLPIALFPFQRDLVRWALQMGRSALLVDTGLGKTVTQLEWARQVVRYTGGNVLILTPLAVSHQTVRESEKFGIEVRRSIDGRAHRGITVTNDERHVHPLQLDVIERVVTLWSNPGDTVLTPFMGVGSEVYVARQLGRRAIGIELKPSYFAQARRNIERAEPCEAQQRDLFGWAAARQAVP